MARVLIAVGSNIDPKRNILAAVRALGRRVRIVGVSTIYRSGPLERPGQPDFHNGAIECETDIPPRELKLGVLRGIEADLGRVRTEDKHAARTIDLDLAVYDGVSIAEPDLTIPDPEIAHRPFLAVPLAELAPDLELPGVGRTLSEIASAFRAHGMEPLPQYTHVLREGIGR
ncbi:MAG: 2-amino-4-hydroxy-6-hydroxymethyldihydropteridine diphosphokinase [Armatimonadota bacterium]